MILLSPLLLKNPENFGYGPMYCVKSNYVKVVEKAGGIPFVACQGDMKTYLRVFDGVLFTGGEDVEPFRYHDRPRVSNLSVNNFRDDIDIELCRAFFNAGKPIFGIRRSPQMINAALGGTLWQDIKSEIGAHYFLPNGRHKIFTEEGSRIRKVCGTGFLTNTYHHQCVIKPAPGFRITAYTDDGVAEAVEHETKPVLAV